MKIGTRKITVGLLVLILFLAAGASVLIFKLADQKKYQKQLSLGDKYLAESDYENAKLYYTNAISINEKRLPPYWGLCNTYIGLGDYDRASEVVEEMQEIDDKYYKNAKQEKIQDIITVIDERKKADSIADIPQIKEPANEEPEEKPEHILQEETVAAYEAFLKQNQFQGVRYAILNADINQKPVLIIATETEYVEQYPTEGYDFDIYCYIDGSVVKVGHEGNRHSYGPWYFDGKQILCKSFARDENMSGTHEVKYLRIDGAEVSSEAEFDGELPEEAEVISLLKNEIQ